MRHAVVVVAAVLVACQPRQSARTRNGDKRPAARAAVAEARGRFLARGAGDVEHELELRKLTVDVTTQPGTVRSHVSMEVVTAAAGLSEAMFRLPVPRGAAVTGAVLWVNDKPMRGAF